MRRRFLFLAAGGLAAAAAVVASCSSTITSGPFEGEPGDGGSGFDAGSRPDAASSGDGGLVDATAPPPEAGVPQHAATIFINASPDLREVRLCIQDLSVHPPHWVTQGLPLPSGQPMPDSNYAGIPPGGGVVLPALPAFQNGGSLEVFAINARTIASSALACKDLICSTSANCLTRNADYYELTAQPPPSAPDGVAYLVAITGCLPDLFDDAGSVARCGAGYTTSAGNLGVATADLTSQGQSGEQGTFNLQLAQLSPSLESALADASLDFRYPGAPAPAAAPPYPAVAPTAPALNASLPDASTDFAAAGIELDVADAAAYSFSLASITEESDPTSLPSSYFVERRSYLFAIVGDVTSAAAQPTLPDGAPNPAYDGHGLHVVAFPTTVDAGSL